MGVKTRERVSSVEERGSGRAVEECWKQAEELGTTERAGRHAI